MVLDFLAVDNFDFNRKIVKKIWVKNSWKCWGFVKIEFLDKNLTFRIVCIEDKVWFRVFFPGLCMQDGDLDVDEDTKPIIKVKKESNAELVIDKPTKSDDHPLIAKDEKLNGVQIVSNGNAKHNNNSDTQ